MSHWAAVAYVGPGAGFAFLGSLLSLVTAVVAGIFSALLWPFRMAWSLLKGARRTRVKKAIFLGFDGFDPRIAEKLMAEGRLPNLARLRDEGSYSRLRTTFPPLSPVAWSTFATGVNPGKHNIFDFLNRNLRSYAPELSSAKVWPAKRFLHIGRWRLPLSRASVEMRRKSEPFWKILGRHAIKSTILRVPVTFPPEPFNGRELSAMCTPDLLGTQGTYARFTSGEGTLSGPEGSSVPFRVRGERIEIAGESYALVLGQYTPWIRLKFGRARGIVRFLLVKSVPEVELYATPVQIDPENPALPISHPRWYAIYLAKLLGTFATLGLAEDTNALNDGAIDGNDFLRQAESIQIEREAMFFSALERTKRGVVACVFDTTDRVQHMFHGQDNVIEPLYCEMDRIVSKTMAHVDGNTAMFVLSDHGFCAFRREVNLNSWLLSRGYLVLKDGRSESGDYLDGIDWTQTRAYTLGLSGIYLNLRGREVEGMVTAEEAPSLKTELAAQLRGLRDNETNKVAIEAVYPAEEIYSGPYLGGAPDLIIGYADGYRAAWDAATGKATATVFKDNHKAWCGDHCVDPPLVPGVLFSNLKLAAENPGIEDVAPTALTLFGVPVPAWMEGRSVVAAM